MSVVREQDGETSPIIASGVPGLDAVLGGGLPRRALTLIVGPPGSGKTILAAQMAFATARAGGRVLILTVMSESSVQFIEHLRPLRFFDENLLGDQILVLSLTSFLARGLEVAADAIAEEALRQRADLVMMDGFRGLAAQQSQDQTARAFLYALGTRVGLLGAPVVLTHEAAPRDPVMFPEATTADVLLGVYYWLEGGRARRGIEVIKVRGAAPLHGMHGFALSAEGATVYPRLEARVVAVAAEHAAGRDEDLPAEGAARPLDERATFGLPELDAMLGGGLTRGTPTLVLGSSGVGKTLLGLTFAHAGLLRGEATVILGFHETRRELLAKAAVFAMGAPLREAMAPGGGLTMLRQPPVDVDPDRVAGLLLDVLERTGARRLVIDNLTVLERAVADTGDPHRLANYLGALVEVLGARGVTTLFLKESAALASTELALEADLVSVVAANVLWLQQVTYNSQLYRVVSVPKMRFSAHDITLREFTISAPRGMHVRAPFRSDHAALAGIAQRQGSPGLEDAVPADTAPHDSDGPETR